LHRIGRTVTKMTAKDLNAFLVDAWCRGIVIREIWLRQADVDALADELTYDERKHIDHYHHLASAMAFAEASEVGSREQGAPATFASDVGPVSIQVVNR
jgi:hypothetical protein